MGITAKELQALIREHNAKPKSVRKSPPIDLDQAPTKDEPKRKRAPRSSANAAPSSNVVSIKKPAAALNRPAKSASAFRPVKEGSKRHLMAQAMLRPNGATLEELMAVTGWDRNTASGAVIWDLHTCMGLGVRRDGDRYHAILPNGITSILRVCCPTSRQ